MGVVLLSNLHPDLKLGLVLVSAAVLLNFVGWSSFATERYAASGFSINRLTLAGVIGGLAPLSLPTTPRSAAYGFVKSSH